MKLDSAEWLRNLAHNYADGIAGMTPQHHYAWDIADEIDRLRSRNERLRAALRAALEAWREGRDLDESQIIAALAGRKE